MKIHNSKGFSHHLLLPVLAVLLVAGIGGYIMQRGSSAATRSCVERTFSTQTNSSSVCVSYIIDLMKASGKAPKAKALSGSKFGANTKAAVKQYQGQWTSSPDGIITGNGKTWSKLCSQGKSGNKTAWSKAGCGGSNSTASTSSAKGWTSLGTLNALDDNRYNKIEFKISVCKIATSSKQYRVKVRVAPSTDLTTWRWAQPSKKGTPVTGVVYVDIMSNSSRLSGSTLSKDDKIKTETFTSIKALSSSKKVWVGMRSSVENDQFVNDGGSSEKKISTLLTCN